MAEPFTIKTTRSNFINAACCSSLLNRWITSGRIKDLKRGEYQKDTREYHA
jgi:hypothetical protein